MENQVVHFDQNNSKSDGALKPVEPSNPLTNDKELSKNDKIVDISPEVKKMPSVSGAIFNITNLCIGYSIFTFAYRAKSFGLIWMIIAIIVCGFANYWTFVCLVNGTKNLEESSYPEVVNKLYGKKVNLVIIICIVTFHFGCILTYMVIIYSLIGRFIESIFYHGQYASFDDFNVDIWQNPKIKYPVALFLVILMILICLPKDMSKFGFISYVAIGSVFYILIVFLIQCPSYYRYYKDTVYKKDDKDTHINLINISKAFTKKLEFFKNMANLFFAYSSQPGVLSIYKEFKPFGEEGYKQMKRSIFFPIIIVMFLYIFSLIVCFLIDPITPAELTVYRKNKNNDYDIALNIGKIALIITILFSTPPIFFFTRESMANIMVGGKLTTTFNILYTSISLVICMIITLVYDKILNYINYIGGYLAVSFTYLLPIMIEINSSGKPYSHWTSILKLSAAILFCIIGFMGGTLTIIDDFS